MSALAFGLWLLATLPVLTVGGSVSGELTAGDARGSDGRPIDTWELPAPDATTVTVAAESDDLDVQITVVDDSGQQVAADDQGGVGDNARLVFAPVAGHRYRVRVTTAWPEESGPYALRLVAGEDPLPAGKPKLEADLAYYARALERASGAAVRRRGWLLARLNSLKVMHGLAAYRDLRATAEQALAAARDVGDLRLQALALNQCGVSHTLAGQPQQAIPLLEEARALFQRLGDAAGEIGPLANLASAVFVTGQHQRARELLEQALALCERSEDRSKQAGLLTNLAMVHDRLDDYARAVEYQEQALRLARERGDVQGLGIMHKNLATNYIRLGRYQQAIASAEEALAKARAAGDRRAAASALDTLAEAYTPVGRSEKAIACAEAALAIRRELGDPRWESSALDRLAAIHLGLGHHARAIALYEEALRLERTRGDRLHEAEALSSLGAAHARAGEWPRAQAVQREALAAARAVGNRRGESFALSALAEIHLRLGDLPEAVTLAERAVEALRALGYRDLEWSPHTTLARAFAALGRAGRAREEFEAGLALVEEVRADAGGDADRVGYFDRTASLFESYIEFLVAQGQEEAALAVAERARARAFLDLLGSRSRTRAAAGSAPAPAIPPASVDEIKEEARRRQATFVEYFVSADRLFVWVVEPGGRIHAASLAVGRSEIAALVGRMRSTLGMDLAAREWVAREPRPSPRPLAPREAARVLQRLHAVLIRPVEAWLPRSPERLVTIVPHGPLFLVSFAALRDARGRYLVERHTLSYIPSIGTLRYTGAERERAASPAKPRLLVVGNPAMPRLPGRSRPPAPLLGAESEVLAIGRLYPAAQVTTLIGRAAQERVVRELAGSHTMIHLATHGFIRDDEPLDSLMALAAAPSSSGRPMPDDADGLLTVREIFQMQLGAELVVLSGCNTGLGRISGDGVIGLVRAFLYAGSPTVLASLWRVADTVASPHMAQFYGALQRNGGRPAAALRRAQLDTIRGLRARRYRAPSGKAIPLLPTFWASFVLVGEPR